MTHTSKRQRVRFYLYKNQENAKRLYMCTKRRILWKKQDNLRYVLFAKIQTHYVTLFLWRFGIGVYIYTKIMTICITWRFYIQKARHLEKGRQFALRFVYAKNLTLCVTRFFVRFLKLAEGGGAFINKKKNFALNFYIQKQSAFCYLFIHKKSDTLRHIFIRKKNALCVTFSYLKFIV